MSLYLIIIPLLLIFIEGIFTASETGLVSIEYIRIKHAKKEKQRWAHILSLFLTRPERFFATILVSENLILVISSTLFAKYFIEWLGYSGAIFATVLLAVVSLVIGQFVPKMIALSRPEGTMRILGRIIYIIEIIMYPLVSLYAWVAKGLARLSTHGASSDSIQRLDIVYAMSEYQVKASQLAARLFDFSKRQVVEVMIPLDRVFMCQRGMEETAIIKGNGRIFTRIPVYESARDRIVGIFNIKDYFYKEKVILRKPLYADAHDRCMTIFMNMKQKGQHLAIIRNDQKKVIGIITLEDLIEELVGEIRDER
jgi:putative hemolysin